MGGAIRRRSLLGRAAALLAACVPGRLRAAAFGDDEIVPAGVTPTPPAERQVGIAYQLWHYAKNWPAWVAVWGKPELGYYQSADRAVIRQHAEWLVASGVDFILLDWSNEIGADDRSRAGEKWQLLIEDATQVLFEEYAKLPAHPKVAMMLGTPRAPEAITDGRLQKKADQVHAEFVENPAHRKLLVEYLGKPLLVVYVDTPSPNQGGPPPWSDPRFTVRFMTGFLTEQPRLLGPGRVSRYDYWSWEDRGPPTFPVVGGHPEVMTLVAAWRASPGKIPTPGRAEGRTFRDEWALARRLGPRFALIVSFNEWRRGEQPSPEISKDVEPSEQFGHLYLDILKEQAALFKVGAMSARAAGTRVVEAPFGSALLTLESPAFDVPYPFIHDKELIASNWLPLLEQAWGAERFEPRAVTFYRLRDVFVAIEGLVFDKYLDVVEPSVTGHAPGEIERGADLVRAGMRAGTIPVHMQPALLCTKRGATNYGHFMAEMLPKAWLAEAHLAAPDLHYVVPAATGALGDVVTDAFGMLGVGADRLVRCGQAPAFFREIVVVDGLTVHGQYMSPLVTACLDALGAAVEAGPAERIYVSRGSAHYRKLRNEGEIAEVLARHGYAVVDPGTMPLAQQIAAFKGARSVIGVDGAGMTNIGFARPGATVTCLTPGSMPETFYWFLSIHKGHDFRDVRLAEVGEPPPGFASWCADVAIEPAELERWLLPAGARA